MKKLTDKPHHSSTLIAKPDTVNRGEPVTLEFTWWTADGDPINIENADTHIKMVGFYDHLENAYYRFSGGKKNVYTLTKTFVMVGIHKLQAFFNSVDTNSNPNDDKKLLDIHATVTVRLPRSVSNPGMSLTAGDAGGVNYDSAERAIQIDTTDGSKFLWYPTGCVTKFDPQAENAKTSELLNILKKAGLSYDKNRLDNVVTAILKLIEDNSYSPSKIFACTLSDHNVCDPNFKIVVVTKTEKGCILEEISLSDLLATTDEIFNISNPYSPALAKIVDGDNVENMDIVFQDYVNNQGKPENQLKTMKFTEFLNKYVPKLSEPFKDTIIDKQDTDDGLQAVLVKKLPNGDNQLVKTPISDILSDTSFDISKPFKQKIIETPTPIYRGITEVNINEKSEGLKANEDDGLYQLYAGDIGINPAVPLKSDVPTINTPADTALTTVTDEHGIITLAKAPINFDPTKEFSQNLPVSDVKTDLVVTVEKQDNGNNKLVLSSISSVFKDNKDVLTLSQEDGKNKFYVTKLKSPVYTASASGRYNNDGFGDGVVWSGVEEHNASIRAFTEDYLNSLNNPAEVYIGNIVKLLPAIIASFSYPDNNVQDKKFKCKITLSVLVDTRNSSDYFPIALTLLTAVKYKLGSALKSLIYDYKKYSYIINKAGIVTYEIPTQTFIIDKDSITEYLDNHTFIVDVLPVFGTDKSMPAEKVLEVGSINWKMDIEEIIE